MGNKVESELEKYLSEPVCEADKGFLSWWSDRMKVYPILSRIDCDDYSIPITTVASESCFSTAGCIINEYRFSLAPKTAEALICCQDWLRHRPVPVIFNSEDMDFIESLEEDAHSILEGSDSTILRGYRVAETIFRMKCILTIVLNVDGFKLKNNRPTEGNKKKNKKWVHCDVYVAFEF